MLLVPLPFVLNASCTLQVSPAYLMSIVVMVNEKKRERMPAWEVGQTDRQTSVWLALETCMCPPLSAGIPVSSGKLSTLLQPCTGCLHD